MSLALVRELPESLWSCFVREHPQGNVFHTPEMFQVFDRTRGCHPELWAVTKNGRILVLFLPVQVTLRDGFLRPFTTRAIAYGSILCTEDPEGLDALNVLLDAYTQRLEREPIYTELRNLCNLGFFQRVLCNHGFSYEDHLNYLVDLKRSPEILFQSFGPRTRKHLRRALKSDQITIREAADRAEVARCYRLVCQSYHFAHIPIPDQSLFDAAFDVLRPKNRIRFTLACVNDQPGAASVELLYKNVIYGWYGGIDRSLDVNGANELLTWNILKWGAESGYHLYDWGGAGRADTDYNVRNFKAKFGGELVCFGRNTCIHSPRLLQISKMSYALLRRFF